MSQHNGSMRFGKRLLAALFLLLGTAGLLLSLVGGVGVWFVKEPATARATRLFGRIETALDRAELYLRLLKESLGRAAESLDRARDEQRKVSRQPQANSAAKRRLARMVQKSVAPELGDAQQKLQTVAEAAVVVNSVLEDVGNFPFVSVSGLDTDGLARLNKNLSEVGPAAWELGRLLADPEPDADADSQFNRIDRGLGRIQRLLAEYGSRVREVRTRTEKLRSRTFAWISPGTVLFSVVCFWVAVSQGCVLFLAGSWWKGSVGPASSQRESPPGNPP